MLIGKKGTVNSPPSHPGMYVVLQVAGDGSTGRHIAKDKLSKTMSLVQVFTLFAPPSRMVWKYANDSQVFEMHQWAFLDHGLAEDLGK